MPCHPTEPPLKKKKAPKNVWAEVPGQLCHLMIYQCWLIILQMQSLGPGVNVVCLSLLSVLPKASLMEAQIICLFPPWRDSALESHASIVKAHNSQRLYLSTPFYILQICYSPGDRRSQDILNLPITTLSYPSSPISPEIQ